MFWTSLRFSALGSALVAVDFGQLAEAQVFDTARRFHCQ